MAKREDIVFIQKLLTQGLAYVCPPYETWEDDSYVCLDRGVYLKAGYKDPSTVVTYSHPNLVKRNENDIVLWAPYWHYKCGVTPNVEYIKEQNKLHAIVEEAKQPLAKYAYIKEALEKRRQDLIHEPEALAQVVMDWLDANKDTVLSAVQNTSYRDKMVQLSIGVNVDKLTPCPNARHDMLKDCEKLLKEATGINMKLICVCDSIFLCFQLL